MMSNKAEPFSCPTDCPMGICGNGRCDRGESIYNCPIDCGHCGDGICDVSEHCGTGTTWDNCYLDCGACQ